MSWSIYLLVAIIALGLVLIVALFGTMIWLVKHKNSEESNP